MSRKDTQIWLTHKSLREEAERIIMEARKNKLDLNLVQATYLASIRSKKGVMTMDEAWEYLEKEGLLKSRGHFK